MFSKFTFILKTLTLTLYKLEDCSHIFFLDRTFFNLYISAKIFNKLTVTSCIPLCLYLSKYTNNILFPFFPEPLNITYIICVCLIICFSFFLLWIRPYLSIKFYKNYKIVSIFDVIHIYLHTYIILHVGFVLY